MKPNLKEIYQSVKFMQNWIETDLRELQGDTKSDYAKFVLEGHEHINVAINVMQDIVDPTRGYAE